MSDSLENAERRILPRWRGALSTLHHGEAIATGRHEAETTVADDESRDHLDPVEERLSAWRLNRSLAFATDLMSSAFVLNRAREAEDAALFVLAAGSNAPVAAVRLAQLVLGSHASPASGAVELHPSPDAEHADPAREAAVGVRRTRARLREYPANPLAWLDLSRYYASLGLRDQAERAMHGALSLAPHHRVTLRAASRLYVHNEDVDRAVALLRRSPTTPRDPWLLAAEIATSMVAKRAPHFVKEARRVLTAGDVPPLHISELAAALGSLEVEAGSTRAARKLFARALVEPTENTVAQAEWVTRRRKVEVIDERHLQLVNSYEARAWDRYGATRWKDALLECTRWLQDEPFSRRPPIFGSFVASVPEEDYERAELIARIGLEANPHDPLLLNNLAFALASSGKVASARLISRRLRRTMLDTEERAAWLATLGLIQFRERDIDGGRKLYEAAIGVARESKNRVQEAMAALFLAREELVAGTAEAPSRLAAAEKAASGITTHGLPAVLRRLRALAAQRSAQIANAPASVVAR